MAFTGSGPSSLDARHPRPVRRCGLPPGDRGGHGAPRPARLVPAAGGAGWGVAAFTATSAITVTGLIVVDTPEAWTTFGETVIMVLIQLGGIGIMTLASLVLLGLSRRIGLRHRLLAQAESGVHTLGEVAPVLRAVLLISAVAEGVLTVVVTSRLVLAHDEPFGSALFSGLFHAVSAFNNAGFSLYSDNLMGFADDPVLILAFSAAIVLGGPACRCSSS